jgi:cob(I)alamin adenosyltransferase
LLEANVVKIYTRKGDAGETSLFDGTKVPKAHPRLAACGDLDELNAALGVARAALAPRQAQALDGPLESIQRDLLAIGAVLGDPRRAGDPRASGFDAPRIAEMECLIDAWEDELPPLRNFVLPGGSAASAALHVARTVARRAERAVVDLRAGDADCPAAVVYLNRLSDLLFVAARLANLRADVPDVLWRG